MKYRTEKALYMMFRAQYARQEKICKDLIQAGEHQRAPVFIENLSSYQGRQDAYEVFRFLLKNNFPVALSLIKGLLAVKREIAHNCLACALDSRDDHFIKFLDLLSSNDLDAVLVSYAGRRHDFSEEQQRCYLRLLGRLRLYLSGEMEHALYTDVLNTPRHLLQLNTEGIFYRFQQNSRCMMELKAMLGVPDGIELPQLSR